MEANLNVHVGTDGNLVMGYGSYLANVDNYFNVLTQGPTTINDYINEYMQRVGLNTEVEMEQGRTR